MRAAVLREYGAPLILEERPDPQPGGDEVVVRVLGSGVCHSDLHLQDGHFDLRLPFVLGHEIAGVVDDRDVLVYGPHGCGRCGFCARTEEQLCLASEMLGFDRHGGYADTVLVPSRRQLLPLEGLDPVHAAPLADAGLTPYRAVRRAGKWLRRGHTAIVIGVGGLGQFAVQYLKLLTDARVLAVDVAEAKRSRAAELGADETTAPEDVDEPAQVVLDFVGTSDSLARAGELVEQQGLVIQVGAAEGRLAFGIGGVPWEAHFTTSVLGSRNDLADVLEHARRGDIRWHVETLPLEHANDALDRLRRGDVLGRLVLVPE